MAATTRSQAATMVIAPHGSVGDPENLHASADQWLFVLAETGTAIVAGRAERLEPGVLLLIEAGEHHELRNDGEQPLRTLNAYAPPVYD